jgi:hypothetical protein
MTDSVKRSAFSLVSRFWEMRCQPSRAENTIDGQLRQWRRLHHLRSFWVGHAL